MKIINTNLNFKGGAIVPIPSEGFTPSSNYVDYCRQQGTEVGGNRIVPLKTENWGVTELPGNKNTSGCVALNLWGKDDDTFGRFLEENEQEIVTSRNELGFYHVQATRLAKAITEVTKIPEILTKEALTKFASVSDNLTKEMLTPEVLTKALEKIKTEQTRTPEEVTKITQSLARRTLKMNW